MMLERALAYVGSGWAVFPLIPNTKEPLTKHGFKDASKDAEVVKRWWTEHPTANIGIATGEVSGLVVVDVDVKNGAKGVESFSSLVSMTPTLAVETPSGGMHFYYISPGPTRCRIGLLPGIDIKADGGYVVSPGSQIDGKAYEWVEPDAHLVILPDIIINLMAEKKSAKPALPAKGEPIPEGQRNAALASMAGSMRRRNMNLDEVFAALKVANINRCQPLLPDNEVETIARSICNYPPGETEQDDDDIRPPGFTDDALALEFTERYGEDWRYVAAWGYWLHWDGNCWRRENTLRAYDLARLVCRGAAARCDKVKTAAKIASANTVAAVERLSRADRRHAATIDQWDRDQWLLNTTSGVADLRTGQMRPHGRLDYMTKITAAGIADEKAKPERWLAFLHDVTNGDTELQRYLARMAGYALTGVTSEHALFFLYGTGANGKSVFLNTLAAVLGDYATNAPMDTFMEMRTDKHPTDLAGLRGARLVTSIEVEKGRRWAEAKIKSLTGGDKISARFMRQDFFDYKPQFKLLVAGNNKPSMREVDEAMRRRLHLVPFTVTIPAEKRNHALSEQLLEERDAILRWAIDGCLDWQRIGLKPPACVLSATEEYLESEDALGRWLTEECFQNPRAQEGSDALYQSWKAWCEKNGEYLCSLRKFSDALCKRGFKRARSERQRLFQGIALNGTKVQEDLL
jgi:P4 family phage/plasmid primase-like protien